MANMFANRIVGYTVKRASQLAANPLNWRTHPQRQRDAVQASLRELGWIGAVIENIETGYLIDGHERVWQALSNDEEVPVLQVRLSEAEEKLALAVFDPITYMAETDSEILDDLLHEVNTGEAALQELLEELAQDAGLYDDEPAEVQDVAPQVDKAAELQAKWQTATGQLWKLGDHRLICGDCTDEAIVKRLLGDEQPSLVIADPPYGVSIVATVRGSIGSSNIADVGRYAPIVGDETTETALRSSALYMNMYPNAVQVWWGANYYIDGLTPSPCWLVWDKETTGDFADCELAWTNQDKAAKLFRHQWNGMLRDSERERRWHPTQKPAALAAWVFTEFTEPGAIVVDPFAGAGWSVLGGEQSGRKVRAIEISAEYIAIILERWSMATGRLPVLDG